MRMNLWKQEWFNSTDDVLLTKENEQIKAATEHCL